MEVNELVDKYHNTAKSKGWHDSPGRPAEIHMLIVSEVAEATEEVRKNTPPVYQYYNPSQDAEYVSEMYFNGFRVLVDERDFSRVSNFGWYISHDGNMPYLKANTNGTSVSYHNLIISPPAGMLVDHADGNSLNNLRSNLRVCTPSQNQANQKPQKVKTTSEYKGVSLHRDSGRWTSQIGFEGKRIFIGRFEDEISAALAYDKTAIELFGDFARTNFLANRPEKILILPNDPRWSDCEKCEGEAVELADAVIRIFDYFGSKGWDMEEVLTLKDKYNQTRAYRHGGKTI